MDIMRPKGSFRVGPRCGVYRLNASGKWVWQRPKTLSVAPAALKRSCVASRASNKKAKGGSKKKASQKKASQKKGSQKKASQKKSSARAKTPRVGVVVPANKAVPVASPQVRRDLLAALPR